MITESHPSLSDNIHKQFVGRRVFVAGHRGMVGAALLRALAPYDCRILTRSSVELDLRNQAATQEYFRAERPEIVLFAAGKVGGIHANASAPADFLYDNVLMAANAIRAAWECNTQRFVFLGSSCIYPRMAPQPIPESALLTSELEPTNEGYALAKIVGLKLCQMYRRQYNVLFHSLMPTNLYGPGDNYHAERAHVLPTLMRRIHEAKVESRAAVTIWGSGKPLREFLHVDDLAAATLYVAALQNPPDWINVGSGEEVSIWELAQIIAETVGYQGAIQTDSSRPDGTPRKLVDASQLQALGWRARVRLREGIAQTYRDFLRECEKGVLRVS